MDEITFRRHAYSNPDDQTEEFLQARQDNPEFDALVNELKSLDASLTQALAVEPSPKLAEKLLLNTELKVHQQRQLQQRNYLSIAASFALVAMIGIGMWRIGPVDLGANAVAHVQHEPELFSLNENAQYQQLNQVLQGIKGLERSAFTQQPEQVYASRLCDFKGVESLHLVMQGLQNKVSVFIVPKQSRMTMQAQFREQQYQGMSIEMNDSYLVVVGEDEADLQHAQQQLKQSFI